MIVVFGSINVDLVFNVDHLPTAGETVIGPHYQIFHGGKGANQAVAAVRAGTRTEMAGAVGMDHFGANALAALKDEGIGVGHVRNLDAATGCAAIGVSRDGENQIMVAAGANDLVRSQFLDNDLLTPQTTLLAQMEIPATECWSALERAKKAGCRTVLNAAPAGPVPDDVIAGLDFLIVNEIEVLSVARSSGITEADPVACADRLAQRFGTGVLVTLGSRGAMLCHNDGKIAAAAPTINAIDTTGAGDTFCGVFAASLDCGFPLAEAMNRANVAGALSCLKRGARGGMPTAAEIDAGMSGQLCPV